MWASSRSQPSLFFSLFAPFGQGLLARFGPPLLFGWVGAVLLAVFSNAIVIDVVLTGDAGHGRW